MTTVRGIDKGKNIATLIYPTMNPIERDWAGMLPEIVHIIASKIVDIFDFICFRAVCKTWRSVTTIADLSPQFPWILSHSDGPDLQFYSIAFDKSFTIHAPKFSKRIFFCPCQGSLLVRSRKNFYSSMINPLNNGKVSLPIFRDILYEWIGSQWFESRDYVIFKDSGNQMYVFKPGDEDWILIEGGNCSDFFYLNNLLFIVVGVDGSTKVINLSTSETIFVVPPPWITSTLSTSEKISMLSCHSSLIESSGEVLRVTYSYVFNKFEIHRLEVGNDKDNPCWVKITSIGDRMLFIDFQHNFGDFSLRATDFCGFNFKGNCIYFIIGKRKLLSTEKFDYIYEVQRYDLESATIECIHTEEKNITWYLPILNQIEYV